MYELSLGSEFKLFLLFVEEIIFCGWLMIGDVREDSIDAALECLLESDNPEKNIVYVRYTERENGVENEDPRFFNAYFHQDLRQPLVNKDWKIAPVMLINTKWFQELGGLDCINYEHINMNVISLAFRNQHLGYKILYPSKLILSCELQRNRTVLNNPVIGAFFENDLPNFKKEYASRRRYRNTFRL